MSIGHWHGPMDIRHLDYFLACCKAGSFTAAARDVTRPVGHVMRDRPARAGSRDAAVRPGRHAGSPDRARGRRCRRAHSASLTLSRQPGTTFRPSPARSAALSRWEAPCTRVGLTSLVSLPTSATAIPTLSSNCTSPRTVERIPAIGGRRANGYRPMRWRRQTCHLSATAWSCSPPFDYVT
jgi:hypothetical protein